MEKTKIAMYLEEESKPIKKICEKLMDSINYELDKGIENVDTKELGEAIDMIKDLYEAKKEMYEACYYKSIMEAMEKSEEEGSEYDEMSEDGRRGYRGQPRDSRGRYMSRRGRGRRGYEEMDEIYPEEWYRDMDRESMGRMYYNGGGSNSSGGSRGGSSSQGGGSMSGSGSQGGGMSGGGNRGYSESGRGQQSEGRDSREGRSGQSRRGYMESKEQGRDKQEKMKELERYTKELSEDVTDMISDSSPEEKSMLKQKLTALAQKIQ